MGFSEDMILRNPDFRRNCTVYAPVLTFKSQLQNLSIAQHPAVILSRVDCYEIYVQWRFVHYIKYSIQSNKTVGMADYWIYDDHWISLKYSKATYTSLIHGKTWSTNQYWDVWVVTEF